MTFNKTAIAIIVASTFCIGMANADELIHDNQQKNLTTANKYILASDFRGDVVNLAMNQSKRQGWLDFGYKFLDASTEVTWNFRVNDSTLNVGKEGLKLRHNLSQATTGKIDNIEKNQYKLYFQTGSTLVGDIINSYQGATNIQNQPVAHQISASGNNTTVEFIGSTWNGSLYSRLENSLNPELDIPVDKHDTINTVILSENSLWTGSIKNEALGTNNVTIKDAPSNWIVNDYSTVNNLDSRGQVVVDHATLDFHQGQSNVDNITMKETNSHLQLSTGATVTLHKVNGPANIHFMSLDGSRLTIENADNPLTVSVDSSIHNDLGFDESLKGLNDSLDIQNQAIQGTFTIDQSLIGDGGYGSIVGDKLTLSGRTKNTNLITTSELVAIQMMQWRTEADDMNQRMGELRDSTDANGLWVRTYGGKSEASLVDNKFVGFQFGYDHNVASSSANQQFVGGAISYTKGDANFSTGTGDNDTFAFTGYSTWLLDGGSYVDLSAKYGKLNSDFNIKTGLGNLNGDYSTHALAMGVEVGHRLPVTNLFYVEPQLAFTASHIFAEDFGAGQGLTIEQDSINSYVARAGLAVGLKCPDNMGSVWMKASYLYDFDGETTTTAKNASTTNQYAQDFGGGWYELGLGASMNLTKNLHGYADFEYASGSEIETPYKWNVGVRYTY